MSFSTFRVNLTNTTNAPAPVAQLPPVPAMAANLPNFTNAQKAMIDQHRDETPPAVFQFQLLQQADPSMTQTKNQVKNAVYNSRRIQSRAEQSGSWTAQERQIVETNIDKSPSAVKALLKANSSTFRKNTDQVVMLQKEIKNRRRDASMLTVSTNQAQGMDSSNSVNQKRMMSEF